ncbi:Periplasmic thiol-disulfide interchange protein ResA [Pontimonas salivibrio]|uniref:Periplasmic thiol-disulfide interchange protein ResA n=1 Tax=Pontimonas salivibrio TaxID=1159327 RepID=A0A2L2BN02_9MICO|nr:TlpA disulfide reductase family protein [Pontimonas salivibrio]AVG23017.1 Periplasmic thiol-disulfide interchange protein ResA [Pontimonas salivibrio]
MTSRFRKDGGIVPLGQEGAINPTSDPRQKRSARPKALRSVLAVVAVAGLGLVAGCSSEPDTLAQDYGDVVEQDYFSSDGAFSFISLGNRGEALSFSGDLDIGGTWSSADYDSQPMVVNFWFAGCPPCRVEAPDLEDLNQEFTPQGVEFIGVNILDRAPTALSFAEEFGVTYASLMDAESGQVRLSFAGQASPSAVPTTLILDHQHRVAARVNGLITDVDLMRTMISDVLAEAPQ